MAFLIPYSLALVTALVMLFSRRRASLGVRISYAVLTLVLPFTILAVGFAFMGTEPDGAKAVLALFAFFGSPFLVWWLFAWRNPVAETLRASARNAAPPPASAAASVGDGRAAAEDVPGGNPAGENPPTEDAQAVHTRDAAADERLRGLRRAAFLHTPGAMLFGVALADKLSADSRPLFPFLANGWLVDGMLLLGAVLLIWSIGMVMATLWRRPEPPRDSRTLGVRNPRR